MCSTIFFKKNISLCISFYTVSCWRLNDITSRFPINSEAFASEFPGDLDVTFIGTVIFTNMKMYPFLDGYYSHHFKIHSS